MTEEDRFQSLMGGPLGAVPTDDLWEELASRFHACVLLTEVENDETMTIRTRFSGGLAAASGLCTLALKKFGADFMEGREDDE